jgi:hypothetical protein
MRGPVAFLLGALCSSCEPDAACKPLLLYGTELERRLDIPKTSGTDAGPTDAALALTPAMAENLLREVELLETQWPASARDEDLDVLVRKLSSRRSALERALRDFLAIDAGRLDKGLQSGSTMPARRSVVMSRNAVISLAGTARQLCESRE